MTTETARSDLLSKEGISFCMHAYLLAWVFAMREGRGEQRQGKGGARARKGREGRLTIGRPSATPPTVCRRGDVIPPTMGRPLVVSSTVPRSLMKATEVSRQIPKSVNQ